MSAYRHETVAQTPDTLTSRSRGRVVHVDSQRRLKRMRRENQALLKNGPSNWALSAGNACKIFAAHLRQRVCKGGIAMRRTVTILCRLTCGLAMLALLATFGATSPTNLFPRAIATAAASTTLPAIDAALAAQASDQAHKDWNPDAELIQISATTTSDGVADGSQTSTPISFFFRADGKGYQMTLSRYGDMLGAPAPLPPQAVEALPIQFISLKDALALARAKGFSQTGALHPVLQSFSSTDGLRRIGWLFANPGDPLDKQIFVGAEGHQVGSVQQLFGSLRQ